MYSIGIKIPKWNEGQLLFVDDFSKNMCWSCHCDRFDVYNKKNMY